MRDRHKSPSEILDKCHSAFAEWRIHAGSRGKVLRPVEQQRLSRHEQI
jgi:hypothetical protein